MSLPDDLLEQARYLLTVKGKLEQVNLRRVVSASYYALFHLLTSSASSLFTSDARLLARINRSFAHGKIKQVSDSVANKDKWSRNIENLVPAFTSGPELDKLKTIAKRFSTLQEMRHKADYDFDPVTVYTPNEARTAVGYAEEAFERWREIERTDLARLYLASFLLPNQWSEEP